MTKNWRDEIRRVNPHAVLPYGDTMGDGVMQLSFSLPLPPGPEAKEAARALCAKLGLTSVAVTHMAGIGENFTFFVLYGRTAAAVDMDTIEVPRVAHEVMEFDDINTLIERDLGRKIVVAGACTGTDAHTVGIDAIMNMKGWKGDYGLERYPWIEAYNLGAQVDNEVLLDKAQALGADAILVSQVVTQKDVHVRNLTALMDLMEAKEIRGRYLVICGGPRITHELALELGFDAGFGAGATARHVASYIVQELIRRRGAARV